MTSCKVRSLLKKHLKRRQITIMLSAKDDKDMYLRTWLINGERNNNDWRVPWESVKKYARTFVGKHGIAYRKCDERGMCSLDHTRGDQYDKAVEHQNQHKVTDIIGVEFDEGSQDAYAIHRVTDPSFGEKVKTGQIRYVSPSIWPDKEHINTTINTETLEMFIDTTKWKAMHHAFVDNPAYGSKASIRGICEGTETECTTKLTENPDAPGSEGMSQMLSARSKLKLVLAIKLLK